MTHDACIVSLSDNVAAVAVNVPPTGPVIACDVPFSARSVTVADIVALTDLGTTCSVLVVPVSITNDWFIVFALVHAYENRIRSPVANVPSAGDDHVNDLTPVVPRDVEPSAAATGPD